MPFTTIRPNSTNGSGGTTNTLTGGVGTRDGNTSDNSDLSYNTVASGGYTQVDFATFTLAAGAVGYKVVPRARMSGGGTPLISVYKGFTSFFPQATVGTPTGTITTFTGADGLCSLLQSDVDGIAMQWINASATPALVYEAYVDVYYALVPSAPTVAAPTGTITTTAAPTTSWTHVPGTDAQSGQTYYRVKMFSAAQYGVGGFSADTSPCTYDSGALVGSAASMTPATYGLLNGVSYKAYVQTAQTTGTVVTLGSPAQVQWSAWTAGPAFTISLAVPTPTSVSPANGDTLSNPAPTMNCSLTTMPSNFKMKREHQWATNAGFSTGVQTYLEPDSMLSTNPTTAYGWPNPTGPWLQPQGTWYYRVRAIDQSGVYGSYSAVSTVTVAHVPTTYAHTPAGGGTAAYTLTPTLSWSFSDPWSQDSQSKFQVQLWKASAPGTVLDSGLITSTSMFYQFTSGLDSTWKDTELRWKVLVQDSDGVSSGYSVEKSFYLSDRATVTITSPTAAQVITTSAPLFTWTTTGTRSRTQAQWKADINNVTLGTIVSSSGWQNGTTLQWQTPAPTILIGTNYSVTVTVVDSLGLSSSSTNAFTATYVSPTTAAFSADATLYPTKGLVTVDWSGATLDGSFYAWRLYRRPTGTAAWALLGEFASPTTRTYKDYLCPSQQSQDYAVVQVDMSFGVPTEGTYSPVAVVATALSYQLVCPSNDSLNLTLFAVTAENFGDEQEMASINLIGRGRRVEYGTNFGATGTITAAFKNDVTMTARAQRIALETLRASGQKVYLCNPFGDVFQIAITSAAITREAGTGLHEVATVSMGYSEITA